jgi:hypothetical protein
MLIELFLDGIISIAERLGDRFLQVINLVLNPRKITFDTSYLVLDTGYFTFKSRDVIFCRKIFKVILRNEACHLLRYGRRYKLFQIRDNLFIHMPSIIKHFIRKHYRQIDDGSLVLKQTGSSSGKGREAA